MARLGCDQTLAGWGMGETWSDKALGMNTHGMAHECETGMQKRGGVELLHLRQNATGHLVNLKRR